MNPNHRHGMMVRDVQDAKPGIKLKVAGTWSLSDAELLSLVEHIHLDKARTKLANAQGLRPYCDLTKSVRVQAALELGRRYLESEVRARPGIEQPGQNQAVRESLVVPLSP